MVDILYLQVDNVCTTDKSIQKCTVDTTAKISQNIYTVDTTDKNSQNFILSTQRKKQSKYVEMW